MALVVSLHETTLESIFYAWVYFVSCLEIQFLNMILEVFNQNAGSTINLFIHELDLTRRNHCFLRRNPVPIVF